MLKHAISIWYRNFIDQLVMNLNFIISILINKN
jgi:hypothetical protein